MGFTHLSKLGVPKGVGLNRPPRIQLTAVATTKPDKRYVWTVSIDGEADDNWRVAFNVRPLPKASKV